MASKELELVNIGSYYINNPNNPKLKGKYFIYSYGQYISGLSSSKDIYTLSRLGKGFHNSPNLALLERIALKTHDGQIYNWHKESDTYKGDYFIFADSRCEGIVSYFSEAYEYIAKNDYRFEKILIGKKCTLYNEFPEYSTQSPFDKNAIGDLFIYLTARQNRFSYLFSSSYPIIIGELELFFPKGYTNLWIMKRIALLDKGEITIFDKFALDKNLYYVMNHNEIVEEFTNFDAVVDFLQYNALIYEKLIVSSKKQNLYWH